jgi:hypothetical protein
MSFSPIFCEGTPQAETYTKSCREYSESFKYYVKRAERHKKEKNIEDAILDYKKHLRCWKDKEVMLKLARIYVKRKDFYLAKMVYEEAEAQKEIELIDVILKDLDTDENRQKFMQHSLKIANDFKKEAKSQKQLAVALITIGTAFAATGLGLFIHERAFDGNCPKPASYSLMFGGLSLIGGGIAVNFFSDLNKVKSTTYAGIADNHFEVGATPEQYYEFSKNEVQTRKKMVRKLRVHGASFIILSAPLLLLSAFSFYDTFHHDSENSITKSYASEAAKGVSFAGAVIFLEIATVGAGALFLGSGIKMIATSYKWERKERPPNVIELTNISPMINPVTKTYGISLGFSF